MTDNHLRDERGGLIGGLVVDEYTQGIQDFESGSPPPRLTTPSYDLGRARAARLRDERDAILRDLEEDARKREERLKSILTPAQYAEYRSALDRMRPTP